MLTIPITLVDTLSRIRQSDCVSGPIRCRRLPNHAMSNQNLMTAKETAEFLRIPLPTVYYLMQRGQLPAVQIGGRWRVKRDLLERDVLRNQEATQPTVLVVDDDAGIQS